MARKDIKGRKTSSKTTGDLRVANEAAAEIQHNEGSNIEVGDFVSELASAIRYREKTGLREGDWLEEPERAYTDGMAFAEEESVASGVKLQIALVLDASSSMWVNDLMPIVGPVFMAMDKTLRKAAAEMPEGSLRYAPFIFHETAHELPEAYVRSYFGTTTVQRPVRRGSKEMKTSRVWPFDSRSNQREEAEAKSSRVHGYPLAQELSFPLSGAKTLLAPLFTKLAAWEADGDHDAVRLDIVLTDGELENEQDTAAATRTQDERNGRLRTVFLNFLPVDQWGSSPMPGRVTQYAVNKDNLATSLREFLTEAIADLL